MNPERTCPGLRPSGETYAISQVHLFPSHLLLLPAGGLTNRGHGSKQKHVPAGSISKSCSPPVPPGPPAPSRLHAARPLASSRASPLNVLFPLRGRLSSARCPWMAEVGDRREEGKRKASSPPLYIPLCGLLHFYAPLDSNISPKIVCNSQFSPTGLINQLHVTQLLVSCRCLFFTAPGTLGLCFSLCRWSLTALPDSAAVPGPALPSAVSPLGIAYTRLTSPLCL